MYVPVQLHGVDFRALIDSGASDNFISSGICDHLRLSRHPLKEPLTMQLADGSYTSVGSYTRPHLKIGELKLRMVLKIVETPLPLILGFSFLQFFNPRINWKTRELEIEFGGESFLIQAFPSLLSFKQSSGKLTPAQVIQLLQAAPAQQIQLSAAQFPVSDFEVLCKASENPTAAAKVFSLTTTEPISSDSDSSNHPQKMRKKDNPSSDGDGPDTSPEEVELSNNDKRELFHQLDHHRISRKAGHLPTKPPPTKPSFSIDHSVCGPPLKTVPTPEEIKKVIARFPNAFTKPERLQPPSRPTDHRIQIIEGSRPPARRIYRLSPNEEQELKMQLEDHLKENRIRPSNSPYGASVVFADKKDGGKRMCVDYRQLNKITIADKYPLPRIDELLDQFGSKRIFSKMDLSQGYHQIRMAEDDIHKTSFQTKFGTYEWMVMPFGLTNAPATFQRTMDQLFGSLRDFVQVYIDDIVISSHSLDEHLVHLEKVFAILEREQLYVKESKCAFGQPEIEFVGFIVGENGVRPIPDKLQVINNWPKPKTVKHVRSFLGICGFYHRFIPAFASIATPLTNLLHKNKRWSWGATEDKSFGDLKRQLLQQVVLAYPDPSRPYHLYTDASETGTGAMLCQPDVFGHLKLIACTSRKLNPHERNYVTHEKELLALVDALKKWRHYLQGPKVQVFTDNTCLKNIQTVPKPSPRQVRWIQFLQSFDLDIHHIPGRTNVVADILSRLHSPEVSSLESPAVAGTLSTIALATVLTPFDFFLAPAVLPVDDWLEDYREDPVCKAQFFHPDTGDIIALNRYKYNRFWQDDKIVVPRTRIPEVISSHHDPIVAGHWGNNRTLSMLKRRFIFPKMKKRVSEHVSSCDTCQHAKADHHLPRGLMENISLPVQKWQSVAMDWTEVPAVIRNGVEYNQVLVVIDRGTRMCHLIPTSKSADAVETADLFLHYVVKYHGLPRSITSDRDSRLTSGFWRRLCDLLNIRLRPSSSYHPQTNGQTERLNQTLKQLLRASEYEDRPWIDMLDVVEIAINNAPLVTTDFSPYFLNYGFHPTLYTDVPQFKGPVVELGPEKFRHFLKRLQTDWEHISCIFRQHRDKMVARANLHIKPHPFKPGDLVLVNSRRHTRVHLDTKKALDPKAIGPFEIERSVGPNTYRLLLPEEYSLMHPVFHANDLIPYVLRLPFEVDAPPDLPTEDADDPEEPPPDLDPSSGTDPPPEEPSAISALPPPSGVPPSVPDPDDHPTPTSGSSSDSRSESREAESSSSARDVALINPSPEEPPLIFFDDPSTSAPSTSSAPLPELLHPSPPTRPPPRRPVQSAAAPSPGVISPNPEVTSWPPDPTEIIGSSSVERYTEDCQTAKEQSRKALRKRLFGKVRQPPGVLSKPSTGSSIEPFPPAVVPLQPDQSVSSSIGVPLLPQPSSSANCPPAHSGCSSTRFPPDDPSTLPGPRRSTRLKQVHWSPQLETSVPTPGYRPADGSAHDDSSDSETGFDPASCRTELRRLLRPSVDPPVPTPDEIDAFQQQEDKRYKHGHRQMRERGFNTMYAEPPAYAPNEDVQLDPKVFNSLCGELCYFPSVDLFAWPENAQLSRFYTPCYRPEACGTNAFVYDWSFEVPYANPPWSLLPQVLSKVVADRCELMLVFPEWPHAPWYQLARSLEDRSVVLDGSIYLDSDGHLRPPPKWKTRVSILRGSPFIS